VGRSIYRATSEERFTVRQNVSEKRPKIALVANTDFNLYNFRLGLIRALVARGYEVHIVCPDGEYIQEFAKEEVQHHPLYIDRKGTNPINELRTLWQLYRVFRRNKFDVIHSFTIKPNIYGGIAAKLTGVPAVINSVTGLGYVFTEGGRKKRLLRRLVVKLYRFAFKFCNRVIFQNEDDLELFQRSSIVDSRKGILIKSSGVDVEKYSSTNVRQDALDELHRELDIAEDRRQVVVSLISRLLWDKGVREFVEAARVLKEEYPDTLFLLVGPIDTGNPAAVSIDYVEHAERERLIRYLGERRDVPEILHISDVATLPSYYREGIPKVLLEAMSMEKPIITTDSVGCREVVEEGRNGFLVPIKDHAALASAIERLINDEELRVKMGKYGREKVLREFDERIVVSETLQLYEELLALGSEAG
jgi:N,N'-diacetylbacillosaminyl-diphospho-undecaprenol alpha-1,3-N-acetylgalactosaminyltransferase